MSRLRRIEERDRFFFVTTNLAKDIANLSAKERSFVLENLDACREKMGFKIFAYVVMPDHVHMMIEPAGHTLTSVMREFKSKTALLLNQRRGAAGPLWQTRFFDFICRRVRDFWAKVEYIHQNPVTEGLVKLPEEMAMVECAILAETSALHSCTRFHRSSCRRKHPALARPLEMSFVRFLGGVAALQRGL